jgi:5,10-methylenetetrahydromethanopterin reductase
VRLRALHPTHGMPGNEKRRHVKIGLFAGTTAVTVDDAVAQARAAADDGFGALWYPQVAGLDALTVLAVIAREVPDLHLGTAVVPIQGRHPLPLALAALTVADAAGPGRFTLGLGVTHPSLSEGWFGVPYRGIVDACAEVLEAVDGLFSERRRADVDGTHLSVHVETALTAAAPSVMLAALGPRMIDLAGRASDGTITWMTGPSALGERITPTLHAAAAAAGRPAPRIVVGIPVCVTDDPAGARDRLAPMMDRSATMPSYRRQIDAEGVAAPVDLVVLGDEDAAAAHLARFEAAGMTELCATVAGSAEERARTRRFLATLAS